MRPFDDPRPLTPDQRLCALAHVLAAAVLRLHGRPTPPVENLDNSGANCLELAAKLRLSVHDG
jgi:hypothetical protein